MRPGFEGMIGAAARVQAMNKDETLRCQYHSPVSVLRDILNLGCFGRSIDLLQEGELVACSVLLGSANIQVYDGGEPTIASRESLNTEKKGLWTQPT